MNKKRLIFALPLLLAITLTGCGKSSGESVTAPPAIASSSPEDIAAQQAKEAELKAAQEAATQQAAQQAKEAELKAAQEAASAAAAQEAAAKEAAAQQAAAAAAQNDPKFSTCKEANAAGYGNYTKGEPEYAWYQDRDGDGTVCEKK